LIDNDLIDNDDTGASATAANNNIPSIPNNLIDRTLPEHNAAAFKDWFWVSSHMNLAKIIHAFTKRSIVYSRGAVWILAPGNIWQENTQPKDLRLAVSQHSQSTMQ